MATERASEVDTFLEEMDDELTIIYRELSTKRLLTSESLPSAQIDRIIQILDALSDKAKSLGFESKAQMLRRLYLRFYLLNTQGVSDNPDRFPDEAANAFEQLETALLALDGMVEKNRGRILQLINLQSE